MWFQIFLTLKALAAVIAQPSGISGLSFSNPQGLCSFDLDSYTGAWYEIGSSDYVGQTMEKGCSCPGVYYTTSTTQKDTLDITNSCIRNGYYYAVNGTVSYLNQTEPEGNLYANISNSGYSQTANYIVLKLWSDANGSPQYALVGGNTENYWWLLSRTPSWDSYIWYNANSILEANYYNTTGYRVPVQVCEFLGGHGGNNIIPPPGGIPPS